LATKAHERRVIIMVFDIE